MWGGGGGRVPGRRNILCVVSRPTVREVRSVRRAFCLKNRGFCRVRPRDGIRACRYKLLCPDNESPPYCNRQVSGCPGARSPARSSESLAAAPRAIGPRSLRPAETGRAPRRHFLSVALAVLSPAAMMGAPGPFFPEPAWQQRPSWVRALCCV